MSNNKPFTTFLSQNTATTLTPFIDPNRIYSNEHDPAVYGCANTPRRRSVQLLNLPQRRWYELNCPNTSSWPPPPLSEEDEDKLEKITARHIAHHPELFNTINIDEDNHATYEVKASIGIPLRKQPIVSGALLPVVKHVEIKEKKYFFRAVDTCVWNGMRCMFKQLEFDGMIGPMQREIWSRERLLHYFGGTENSLLSEHGVCPAIAIVVVGDPPLLYGILLPWAGINLDNVSDGQIAIRHLISLVETAMHLRAAGVTHGDICERNVCVQDSSIQLIDFGELAPDYDNDVVATGCLLRRCVDRMDLRDGQKNKVLEASVALIEREDVDLAISILRQSMDM
jgi:hypothetical protein